MTAINRRIYLETFPLFYPYGNTPSKNVLADFNESSTTPINVSLVCNNVCCLKSFFKNCFVQILLVGCGDVRTMLHTVSQSLHYSRLKIHLNDNCVLIIARNIVILKTIHHPDFNVNNEIDLKYLWDVWYNLEWPKLTCDRFIKSVSELCDGHLPGNFVVMEDDLKMLVHIWKSWIATASEMSQHQLKTIRKERLELSCSEITFQLCETIVH